jgi:MFS family permease
MGIYRDLVRNRGVLRILLAQLTARIPFGMLTLIILLHMQQIYGNYTSAGLILAAMSAGQAVSGPLSGRLMGRFGMRPVLTVTTFLCSSLLITIALTQLPLVVVAILALLMGLSTPPVTPAVRTIYPRIVPNRQVTAIFSLDATLQEVIWIVGPVIAVFVSTQLSTVTGLLVAAAFMLGGGLWFILSPEVGSMRIPRPRRGFGAVLIRPTVIVATGAGFFFVASFAALEAGIISIYGHEGIEAGILLALFSGGSVVGGLLFGHRDVRPWSLTLRVLIVVAGISLCLVSLNPFWLGTMLFIAGFGTAPTLAALYMIISSTVRFSETAEAYGWAGTGQLVGAALGSAVAGIAIDHLGPHGGLLAAVGFLVATVAAVSISIPWVPDLRGRDAAPIPDTEPLQVITGTNRLIP